MVYHPTATQLAEANNVSCRMIHGRIARGWDDADLLKPKVVGTGSRAEMVVIDGISKSISEWSKASGLSVSTLRRRSKAGVTGRNLLKRIRNVKIKE